MAGQLPDSDTADDTKMPRFMAVDPGTGPSYRRPPRIYSKTRRSKLGFRAYAALILGALIVLIAVVLLAWAKFTSSNPPATSDTKARPSVETQPITPPAPVPATRPAPTP
jgi:hypothetical protein